MSYDTIIALILQAVLFLIGWNIFFEKSSLTQILLILVAGFLAIAATVLIRKFL